MSRKDEKRNISGKNIASGNEMEKSISERNRFNKKGIQPIDLSVRNGVQMDIKINKSMPYKKKESTCDADIKELLKIALEAPTPQRKEQFIKTLPKTESRVSTLSFILSQAAYIPKWVWLISLLLLAGAVFVAGYYKQEAVWMVSAFMPFVAVSALVENSRSQVYNMAELEMASRFSLRSVLLARMSIIGLGHLLLLAILIPFVGNTQMVSMGRTGVYLLVPYLLTNVLGLYFSRRFHGVGNSYFFLGIACLVSVLGLAVRRMLPILYDSQRIGWWIAVLLLLVGMTISAYRKILEQTEELLWN